MRATITAVLVEVALACACAPAPARLENPAPCVGNDTVYTSDAVGVSPPKPQYFRLPPADIPLGTYRFRVLIDARGLVVADSIEVLEAPSSTGAHRLSRTVAEYRYRPSVRNGCAVRFRTEVSIKR